MQAVQESEAMRHEDKSEEATFKVQIDYVKMEGYTEVFAWGGDHFGQLGLAGKQTGKTYCNPRFCSFNVIIRQVGCGEEHAAFIADNGYVYTMGSNADGRLGIGDHSVRQSASPCLVEALVNYRAVSVNCGWGHTAAVLEDGSVYTWGIGEFGALGLNSLDSQWSPARITMPRDTRVIQVSCGSRHSAMIACDSRSRGRLYVCGSGEAGQLGTGLRERELIPVHVPINEELKSVSCGIFHSAFVTVTGRLLTTGGNSFGQLGIGSKKSVSVPTRVSALEGIPIEKVVCGHHSAALSERGDLYIWGTGVFGEFLTPMRITSISAPVKDIDTGGCFGAAVDIYGVVWTWGSNTSGELGVGDFEPRVNPFPIRTLQGKKVKLVACGGNFAIALGSDIEPTPVQGFTYRQPISTERDKLPLPKKSPANKARSPREVTSPYNRVGRSPPKTPKTPINRSMNRSDSKRQRSASKANDTGFEGLTQLLAAMQIQQEQLRAEFAKEQDSRRKLEQELRTIRRTELDSTSYEQKIRSLEAELADYKLSLVKGGDMETRLKAQEAEVTRLKSALTDKDRMIQMERDKSSRTESSKMLEVRSQELRLRELEEKLNSESDRRRRAEEEAKLLKEALESRTKSAQTDFRLELKQKDEELRALRAELENIRLAYDTVSYKQKQTAADVSTEAEERSWLESKLRETEGEYEESNRVRKLLEAECEALKSALQESRYENSRLQDELSHQDASLDQMKTQMSGWQSRYSSVLEQNSELKGDVVEAELKNRQLFEKIEKNLMAKAREYKERTLNVLATPSPLRGSSASPGNSFAKSPIPSRVVRYQPDLSLSARESKESSPYRRHTDIRSSKSASKLIEEQDDSMSQSGTYSPRLQERHKQLQEASTPPTFREKEENGFKNSLTEINAKLMTLQQNKSALENRMQDFERKLRVPRQVV
mmetsp:Transcript_34143/g.59619  ORF Transcript_34143/g.59619 Transcript_34143/m.59619 type:complete len:940 (-) Transcript_34143:107-2926(-)